MYGFEVHNGDGDLVTDSSYMGYALVQQGVVNVVTQQPTDVSFPSPITSQSPPIICIQVKPFNYTWIRLCRVIGSPGNWTGFRVVGDHANTQYGSLGAVNFRVYAVGVQSSESWGMRIRNDKGEITFDSGTPIMEFKEIITEFNWPRAFLFSGPVAGGLYYKIEGWVNFNIPVANDDWFPLSMSNVAYATTHQSNVSGRWNTYPLEVEVCWWRFEGGALAITNLLSNTAPMTYEILFPVFCPIVKN